ncbi:CPBP family intramembrane glutamic endopeptidase [Demequina maris]|uniref:CPBP family intramembrane glutamic endopeptidase n=1 Tax=Demequina maris TaxID=1638982 RepID=UPI0009E312EB|nr:type II CAAX endopeptidase family protein [Demequina maris]
MKRKPSVMLGIAAYVLYVVVIVGLTMAIGPDYDEIGDSVGTLAMGVLLPIGAGVLGVVVLATVYGWWGPILRDRARARHAWIIILPIATLAIAVANLATVDFGAVDLTYLLVLVLAMLLVGFGEELTTRGVLLVGARGSMGEVGVFFVTTGLFALMHSSNVLFGQDAAVTAQQVGVTFVYGAGYYVMRRATGSLIPAMLMHATWDFSLLLSDKAGEPSETVATLGMLTLYVLTIPCVIFAIKGAKERLGTVAAAADATV